VAAVLGVVAEIIAAAEEDFAHYKSEHVKHAKNKNASQAYFHYATKPMNSPLHWAIFKGHYNIVCRLLLANFSCEVVDLDGNTPLHLACASNHPNSLKIAELLLSKGVDPRRQNKLGNQVLRVCPTKSLQALVEKAQEAWETEESFLCQLSKKYFPTAGGFASESITLDQGSNSHPQVIPVRYSKDCAVLLKNTEAMLKDQMEEDDIDALVKAIETGMQVGVDNRLLAEGRATLAKLQARVRLRSEMQSCSVKRPLKQRYEMNALIHAVTDAKKTGVDEMDVHPAEVLLRISKAEFSVTDTVILCGPIGPYRNGDAEAAGAPDPRDPEGKRHANDEDKTSVSKLDAALDYIKSELEAAPELDSPPDALALMQQALILQKLLHVEIELNSSIQLPVEEQIEEAQPDGSTVQYTHSDGTIAKTKLTSLQSRMARIEKAIGDATEADPAPGADTLLVEKVKAFTTLLGEELAEAQLIEEERLKKEEAARLKAERKKKKKK